MNKKSILYIITKSVWGGAGKYVYDLSTNLTGDFNVAVAAGGKNILAQKLIKASIPYYEIKNFQRDINLIKEPLALMEILKLLFKIKPDVVHTNSSKAGGTVGLAVFLYKLITFRKPKTIFTAHGWAFNEDQPKTKIFFIKLLSRLTAFFSDQIICVSEYDRRTAIKNKIAPAKKLTTIHNGVAIKNLLTREEAQQKLMGKTSPLVIGTIAEWHYNKGLVYFLEAVKDIRADIIMIGSGENKDKEKINQLTKGKKNIYLHEFVPDAASYLKAFDVFVLPSIKEGLPYTLLEAALAGIPIVATNVGGIPEITEGIEPKNSRLLAEKIKEAVGKPAEELKEKIEREFSLEKMVSRTKALYLNAPSKTL